MRLTPEQRTIIRKWMLSADPNYLWANLSGQVGWDLWIDTGLDISDSQICYYRKTLKYYRELSDD